MKTLRDDQAAAIDTLRASFAAGNRRVVMQGSTGYGKTLVAAAIIRNARDRDKRVLMTVPALSLVDQTVEVLYEQGIEDVGVIQSNHVMTNWSKPVQVASVQTLQRREVPKCDLKLIDECHIKFKFYDNFLLSEEQRNIPTIGLSATPWSKGLGLYYEDLIIAATTADLIAKGFLAPFRVFAPSHPDLKGVRTMAGDYHEGDLGEAMNKGALVADIVKTWQAKAEGRPTICFAVNRAHAKAISERFEAAGIGAGYMDCDTDLDERKRIRGQFERGEINVVCNVDVIGMGVDWPEIGCVIYARPTKSEMRYVQNIGRALRVADGKTDALILDHSDTTLRLGFVTDIIHQELDDGKPKASAPSVALPKECKECSYLKPPRTPVCPNCGHEAKHEAKVIETRAGQLQELSSRRPTSSPASAKFPDRRAIYGQLAFYAAQKNYKPGWAANKYRDLYGVWPRGMDDAPRYAPTMELASWIKATQIRYAKGRAKATSPEARQARDDAIIASVREQFLPGTLCTQSDLEEFR